jgi:hypothetical protein
VSSAETERRSNLIVALTSGETAQVLTGEPPTLDMHGTTSSGLATPFRGEPVTGSIYTTREDMPSLERLLEENRIASAVFEREVEGLSRHRVAIAAAIASAVITLGVVLLLSDLVGAIEANAIVALFIILAGIVYTATIASALRK